MTSSLLSRAESHANATLDALRAVSAVHILPACCGADLLHERARLMNLAAQGQRSANGSCHLLQAQDGWLAINLSRETDWQLLPALLEQESAIHTVDDLQAQLQTRSARKMVERGSLLGLAIAHAVRNSAPAHGGAQTHLQPATARDAIDRHPLVVDLSALWAGPLCSRLLMYAGARVIELHNRARPDGMALNKAPGAPEFYHRLHAGKDGRELDFRRQADIEKLRELLHEADIVIESARPRALQQLGIDAEKLVADHDGLVWVSITGYGRYGDDANRIAFGDDAAISAGLFDIENDKPCFIGDAIADPLSGLHAALAAWTHWQRGDAVLLDINLHNVAAQVVHT
jgi:crotonobetainyl-CoA:carnitine CoA-transferase CaiB-like acyl-CoA transferase